MEMAAHLRVLGCRPDRERPFSCRTPWNARVMGPLAALGPDRLAVLARLSSRVGADFSAGNGARWKRSSHPDAAFVRWGDVCWARLASATFAPRVCPAVSDSRRPRTGRYRCRSPART